MLVVRLRLLQFLLLQDPLTVQPWKDRTLNQLGLTEPPVPLHISACMQRTTCHGVVVSIGRGKELAQLRKVLFLSCSFGWLFVYLILKFFFLCLFGVSMHKMCLRFADFQLGMLQGHLSQLNAMRVYCTARFCWVAGYADGLDPINRGLCLFLAQARPR